jgi:hypothetical protein
MISLIVILTFVFGGIGQAMITNDDITMHQKAIFQFNQECTQVKQNDEVCVDLTDGTTALYVSN